MDKLPQDTAVPDLCARSNHGQHKEVSFLDLREARPNPSGKIVEAKNEVFRYFHQINQKESAK